MTDQTDRFKLPFILPGQAQKELSHNEALAALDALLHPGVEGGPLATPPVDPQAGEAWIVGIGAAGAWAGKEHMLAVWTEGGWRFLSPAEEMAVWDRAGGYWRQWRGTSWSAGELVASNLVIAGRKLWERDSPRPQVLQVER